MSFSLDDVLDNAIKKRKMELEILKKGCCAPYCDCVFPKSHDHYQATEIKKLVKCRCGEEEIPQASIAEWKWYNDTGDDTLIIDKDVTFHPTYSQGTAIVRGQQPLGGGVHYWEMRIITRLAGTDVMFGVGTDKIDLNKFKFHFVSGLGTDSKSWGFSYNGKTQHNGVQQIYGQRFSQGCLVGVYLDRTHGHLEFFLNRRSLGIAYTNIPTDLNIKIYPMICSTTARSAIRLINATSQPECLQLRAFKALSKQPESLKTLQQMPGFRKLLQAYWFLAPPIRYSQRSAENEIDIADEAVLPNKKRKQKYTDDEADINDLYGNAHKIATIHYNESDDEPVVGEYFDEYFHYLS